MRRCTASHGIRRSAPISGGPNGSLSASLVKYLTMFVVHVSSSHFTTQDEEDADDDEHARRDQGRGSWRSASWSRARSREESVAVFEFDVPAGAKVAAAHSHDGYEETIYGLEGV